MLTFRKTRDGKWAAFGPVGELRVGTVTIHKADGSTKQVEVASISRAFDAGGVQSAFGFLKDSKPAPAGTSQPAPAPRRNGARYECPECGDMVYPGSRCWETGMTH